MKVQGTFTQDIRKDTNMSIIAIDTNMIPKGWVVTEYRVPKDNEYYIEVLGDGDMYSFNKEYRVIQIDEGGINHQINAGKRWVVEKYVKPVYIKYPVYMVSDNIKERDNIGIILHGIGDIEFYRKDGKTERNRLCGQTFTKEMLERTSGFEEITQDTFNKLVNENSYNLARGLVGRSFAYTENGVKRITTVLAFNGVDGYLLPEAHLTWVNKSWFVGKERI